MANIDGTTGSDTLVGGDGSDVIEGKGGVDTLIGGGGDDYILTTPYGEADTAVDAVYGGTGTDWLHIDLRGFTADLDFGLLDLGGTNAFTLLGQPIEDVEQFDILSGSGDDIFRAAVGFRDIKAGGGRDSFYWSGQFDSFDGQSGDDYAFVPIDRYADTFSDLPILKGGSGKDTLEVVFTDHDRGVVLDVQARTLSGVRAGVLDLDWTGFEIARIQGSTFDDTLRGGAGADDLYGDEGDDRLQGRDGDDSLDGSFGDDTLEGGDGDDTLYDRSGRNVFLGGAGDDRIRIALNDQTIDGGTGRDTLDLYYAGRDITVVLKGSTTSVTKVGASDLAFKNMENVNGTRGDDRIVGDAAANRLFGDAGADTLKGGGGRDSLDGGWGNDTADFSDATKAVVATVAKDDSGDPIFTTVTIGGTSAGTLRFIQNLVGGGADDRLTGDYSANRLSGGAGDDTLTGYGGNDTLTGGLGKDVLDGGNGSDTADYGDRKSAVVATLDSDAQTVVRVAGRTEDTLKSVESLAGGSAGDRFSGDAAANRLDGRAGADVLKGFGGDDTLVGGTGQDSLDGGSGFDIADYGDRTQAVVATLKGSTVTTVTVGGAAEDKIRFIEGLVGGSAGDRLTGDGAANLLTGKAGADVLKGGGGADRFHFLGSFDGGVGGDADRILDFNGAAGDRLTFASTGNYAGEFDGLVKLDGLGTAFAGFGASVRAIAVGDDIHVEANLDDDTATVEFEIVLKDNSTFDMDWLVLI